MWIFWWHLGQQRGHGDDSGAPSCLFPDPALFLISQYLFVYWSQFSEALQHRWGQEPMESALPGVLFAADRLGPMGWWLSFTSWVEQIQSINSAWNLINIWALGMGLMWWRWHSSSPSSQTVLLTSLIFGMDFPTDEVPVSCWGLCFLCWVLWDKLGRRACGSLVFWASPPGNSFSSFQNSLILTPVSLLTDMYGLILVGMNPRKKTQSGPYLKIFHDFHPPALKKWTQTMPLDL